MLALKRKKEKKKERKEKTNKKNLGLIKLDGKGTLCALHDSTTTRIFLLSLWFLNDTVFGRII